MKVEQKEGLLEKSNRAVTPTLGTIATIVALVKVDDPLIKYPAIIVSVILTVITAYPLVAHAFKKLWSTWFPKKLSKEQVERLEILLRDANNYVSTNHSFSIFYAWHCNASDLGIRGGAFQDYHRVVRDYLFDACDALRKFPKEHKYTLRNLSMVIQIVCVAAEGMQRELEAAILVNEVDGANKRRAQHDWSGAVGQFNLWVKEWEKVFKAANHYLDSGCAEYFPQIRGIS